MHCHRLGKRHAEEPHLKSPNPQYEGKIIGGSTGGGSATIRDFPYQLAVLYSQSFICGATIISDSFAVTAAHCIIGSASTLRVRAGSTYYNSGGTVYSVAQAIRHGSYNSMTTDYDVAILRVSSRFIMSSNLQPIALESGQVPDGTAIVVSGWGFSSSKRVVGGSLTGLDFVNGTVSDSACSGLGNIVLSRHICVVYTTPDVNPCQGASNGAPLVADGEMAFKYISLTTVYSVSAQLLTLALLYIPFVEVCRFFLNARNFMNVFTLEMGMTAVSYVPTFLTPVTHWLETRHRIELFNSWSKIEAQFELITGKSLKVNLGKKIKFSLVMINVYLVYLDVHQFGSINIAAPTPWLNAIALHIYCHHLLIVPVFWMCSCSAVAKTAESVAKALEEEVTVYGFQHGHKLAQFRALWIQLSKVTQGIGDSMGLTLGCNITVCLTTQLFYVYFFLNFAINKQVQTIVVMVIVTSIIVIYMECNSAHNASNKVGVQFRNLLQKLESEYPPTNLSADNEIQKFLNTIATNPPVISLYGFANISRELQATLTSVLVTYMVVLFQLRNSTEDPTKTEETSTEIKM